MKNIKIKAKPLFRLLAVLVVSVIFSRCCFIITKGTSQPTTAKVGETITITVNYEVRGIFHDQKPTNGIFALLAPKGWKAAQNTVISFTSSAGDGVLTPIDPNTPDPSSDNPGLTWSEAIMKRVGNGGNLIDDMEWVVYQTDRVFKFNDNGNVAGVITIKLKVGADGNDTNVKLGYLIASTHNGIAFDGTGDFDVVKDCNIRDAYYQEVIGDCLQVTGGTTGDLIDFCFPQYSFLDPPKVNGDDFVSINFDPNANGPSELTGVDEVYFKGWANMADGSRIDVGVEEKTKFTKGADGKFRLTIWPNTFFGVTSPAQIASLEYFIVNAGETKIVGKQNTRERFRIKLKCD